MKKLLLLATALFYSTITWTAAEHEELLPFFVKPDLYRYASADGRTELLPREDGDGWTLYRADAQGFMTRQKGHWYDKQLDFDNHSGYLRQAIVGYKKDPETQKCVRRLGVFYYRI